MGGDGLNGISTSGENVSSENVRKVLARFYRRGDKFPLLDLFLNLNVHRVHLRVFKSVNF
jgi:hypothetical protein